MNLLGISAADASRRPLRGRPGTWAAPGTMAVATAVALEARAAPKVPLRVAPDFTAA